MAGYDQRGKGGSFVALLEVSRSTENDLLLREEGVVIDRLFWAAARKLSLSKPAVSPSSTRRKDRLHSAEKKRGENPLEPQPFEGHPLWSPHIILGKEKGAIESDLLRREISGVVGMTVTGQRLRNFARILRDEQMRRAGMLSSRNEDHDAVVSHKLC